MESCPVLLGEKYNAMNVREKYRITEYSHHLLREYIHEGDCCIDATCGNGSDTEFLCRSVGKTGRVYGFDIEKDAVEKTRNRLEQAGCADQAVLACDGHENMADHVKEQGTAVMFNFGYLPGGDHNLSTRTETSIEAIRQGLAILKSGGIMRLCIYSGKDTGFEEKAGILTYLKTLAPKEYTVIVNEYYNRGNCPPLPVFIFKK